MKIHEEGLPFMIIACVIAIAGGVLAYIYADSTLWKAVLITLCV